MIEEMRIFLKSREDAISKYFANIEHPLKQAAIRLGVVSDYAARHAGLMMELLQENAQTHPDDRNSYLERVKNSALSNPSALFMREMRLYRHKHLLRLMLLESVGMLDTAQVMRHWSYCADALILHTLDYCQQQIALRYGKPQNFAQKQANLITIAMGKLGGEELNFSSDIDLIFAYDDVGMTDGGESISNQQFFTKVVQLFVQIMQNTTADGFIFRVDLRLRPNGDSGALVPSLTAMEAYYQDQGRDWERYAMVKARLIRKEASITPSWFAQLITPFVYRRYVDYGVIESLRGMKAMIEREIQINPALDDIKRGQGGIREIEFIVQNFQLIRGGRFRPLRKQSTLEALDILKKEQLLRHSDALRQAYLFLRKLENCIQSLNDQQTHQLPQNQTKRWQILLAMQYASWEEFMAQLNQYQRIVSMAFRSMFTKDAYVEDDQRMLQSQLLNLWHGHIESTMAANLLKSMGYNEPARCYQLIYAFRHGSRCRRLSQGARMRLDRFMLVLLQELTHVDKTEAVLLQVMQLLDNIVHRSAYLALLAENPPVLNELLFWFAHNSFIATLIINQPFLLEVLLDQRKDWRPLSRSALKKIIRQLLAEDDNAQMQEEILRQFKLSHWLQAARAEFYGYYSAVRIAQFLSDVAHVILHEVVHLAYKQLEPRHAEMKSIMKNFAIIAYGTLGSQEMNYRSDLDLVFIHQVKPLQEALVTRLTQKILHMLTMRTQSGILYNVDTRLRPSGTAGLLISHIDAFVTYQKKQAWTWEHQALVRARMILGGSVFGQIFLNLKREIFSAPKDVGMVKDKIASMFLKVVGQQQIHVDRMVHDELLRLEFLIQFLVLTSGEPALAKCTQLPQHVYALHKTGVINNEQRKLMIKIFNELQKNLHASLLSPQDAIDFPYSQELKALYTHWLS
ncbi:MAG: glutamine-synthetase adenylyltransferase [Legionella sp. 40-6]|nr:MAG: glutamine-synthetase adenylyltransferase [Legionella sp. 40-6]